MLGMGVPWLIYVPRAELHCAISLLGLFCQRTKATYSFQSHGHDGSSSLLPRHAERIDIVDVWAQFPLIVSGELCGTGWQKGQSA
jgi:hypothetical protein